MYKSYQLVVTFLLVLIEKLNQKSNFQPWLAWTRSYKSRIGPKQGENIVFKSREWYYIVSMYKYYQLNLFLVLIWKLSTPIGLNKAL